MAIPPFLYKYRCFGDEYHERILTDGEIYFSDFTSLNDPVEGKVLPNYERLSKDQWQEIVEENYRELHPNYSDEHIHDLVNKWLAEGKWCDPSHHAWCKEEMWKAFNENFGICSLAARWDNQALWAHYSCGHTGFCVEFDSTKLDEYFASLSTQSANSEKQRYFGIHKITYEQEIPILLPTGPNREEKFLEAIALKHSDYAWEEEYRAICLGAVGFPLRVPSSLVTKVILGAKVSDDNIEKARKSLRNAHGSVPLFQCSVDQSNHTLQLDAL